MVKDINYLLEENENLTIQKDELSVKLNEAKDFIEAIKNGNIDAVLIANNETAKVLVSKTADQTYRKFIENMSEGVVTLHTDGIILYGNSSFAKMVNLPLEKVIGTNFLNFIPDDQVRNFKRFLNDYPEKKANVELSMLNQKGIRTHFIVSINKLQLPDFVAVNLVCTDVTDQKKTEEELMTVNKNLQQANEERSFSENKVVLLNNKLKENIKILEDANHELAAFAHIASHDLQEPLRKIITYSSLLARDYYSAIDQVGRGYLHNMQSASERMRNLINDILEYAELSKDSLFKEINLQSVIHEIISNLEILINETKAEILIEKELPVVEANPGQMRQLFQNIISNSLKFIKADIKPEISITYEILQGREMEKISKIRLHEKFCVIYIKDNGIGFSPEYSNKIFLIFQRLHNNSLYQGTGIGLAICKKIVEQHNGFIKAESKPNEGSLFVIALPVSQVISQKRQQKNNYIRTDSE